MFFSRINKNKHNNKNANKGKPITFKKLNREQQLIPDD